MTSDNAETITVKTRKGIFAINPIDYFYGIIIALMFFLSLFLYLRWDAKEDIESWRRIYTVKIIRDTSLAYYFKKIDFEENRYFAVYSNDSNDLIFYAIKEERIKEAQVARIEYGIIFYHDRQDRKQYIFFALELHLNYLCFANYEKEFVAKLNEITHDKLIQYVKGEEWLKLPNGF